MDKINYKSNQISEKNDKLNIQKKINKKELKLKILVVNDELF